MLLSGAAASEGLGVFGEEQGLEGDELMESDERLQRREHVAEAPDGPGGLSKKRQRTEDETLLRPYRDARYQRLRACYANTLNELADRGLDVEQLPTKCVLSFVDIHNANIAYQTRRNWNANRSQKRPVDTSLAPPQQLQQQSMIVAPMIVTNPHDALAALRVLTEVANCAKLDSIVEGQEQPQQSVPKTDPAEVVQQPRVVRVGDRVSQTKSAERCESATK